MKRVLALAFLSILLINLLRASTLLISDEKEAAQIAYAIVQAYTDYSESKENLDHTWIKDLDFEVVKSVVHHVPKNCEVDSLVIANEDLNRWAYFKSVDLKYLRNVEFLFVMKSKHSEHIFNELESFFSANDYEKVNHSTTEVEFKDSKGAYILDDRFQKPVKSKIRSRYNYKLSLLEDYVILDFKEVVSSNYFEDEDSIDEKLIAAKN